MVLFVWAGRGVFLEKGSPRRRGCWSGQTREGGQRGHEGPHQNSSKYVPERKGKLICIVMMMVHGRGVFLVRPLSLTR